MRFKTQCARDCPDACFMDVEVVNGKITSVQGGVDNPVTNGFVCPRGYGDPRRVYSEKRVNHPRIKNGSKPSTSFDNASWNDSMNLISSKLKNTLNEHGPDSVLLLDYSGNTGLVTSQLSLRIWNALGVTHTDHAICSRSGHEALRLHYGLSYGVSPDTLPDKKMITFWGFNARVSSIHQWALAMKVRKKGAKIAVVDPRFCESAEAADLWVRPKPGSDVALSYGVARCIIEKGKTDDSFIQNFTIGYESYLKEVMSWSPSKVTSVTGVKWKSVEALAELMTDRRPGVIMMGIGFQKSAHGAESVRAVSLLPALLGEHRGFYYTNSRGRFIDYSYLSGDSLTIQKHRTVSQVSVGKMLERGDFKFVWVQGMNPVITLPDTTSVRRGLSKTFLVVVDSHMTETCEYADIVLPAPTFLEKEDLVVSDSHQYTRICQAAVEPLGESKPELWVMRELANKLGLSEEWLYEDHRMALKKAFEGALVENDFSNLLSGNMVKVREMGLDEYQTPSGKIEFDSSVVEGNISSLPKQLMISDDGDFILLNSSLLNWTHSQFKDVYGEIPTALWINSEDAKELHIVNGESVIIYNEFGELGVKVEVGEKVDRRVFWSPRPLVDDRGNSQNAMTVGTTQTLGGGPFYNSIKVKIKKS